MSTALVPRVIAALALVLAALTAVPLRAPDAGQPGRAPALLASLDGDGEIQWPGTPADRDERSAADARRARPYAALTPVAPYVLPHARGLAAGVRVRWALAVRAPRSAEPGWPVRLRAPPA